ncbi:hypothetical protein K432DRAFT_404371 [Lepidopterella palustris CBS 459.81]|uniref:Uncharacterized protein n=1 Tax=Lepidopterella palustris CBS 459.81 TaxID=1314670 RepID=A0A8E2JFP2_9PEZI|nr:hypothetical protein K432DRAFT_404371 [Lepidopterella palustris CBS 459.81]
MSNDDHSDFGYEPGAFVKGFDFDDDPFFDGHPRTQHEFLRSQVSSAAPITNSSTTYSGFGSGNVVKEFDFSDNPIRDIPPSTHPTSGYEMQSTAPMTKSRTPDFCGTHGDFAKGFDFSEDPFLHQQPKFPRDDGEEMEGSLARMFSPYNYWHSSTDFGMNSNPNGNSGKGSLRKLPTSTSSPFEHDPIDSDRKYSMDGNPIHKESLATTTTPHPFKHDPTDVNPLRRASFTSLPSTHDEFFSRDPTKGVGFYNDPSFNRIPYSIPTFDNGSSTNAYSSIQNTLKSKRRSSVKKKKGSHTTVSKGVASDFALERRGPAKGRSNIIDLTGDPVVNKTPTKARRTPTKPKPGSRNTVVPSDMVFKYTLEGSPAAQHAALAGSRKQALSKQTRGTSSAFSAENSNSQNSIVLDEYTFPEEKSKALRNLVGDSTKGTQDLDLEDDPLVPSTPKTESRFANTTPVSYRDGNSSDPETPIDCFTERAKPTNFDDDDYVDPVFDKKHNSTPATLKKRNADDDDGDYDEEEVTYTKSGRKMRKPRVKLTRWNGDVWERVSLGLTYALIDNGQEVPYAKAASCVDDTCTGQALQQALWKLRRGRLNGGQPVPPQPSPKSGGNRPVAASKSKLASRKPVKARPGKKLGASFSLSLESPLARGLGAGSPRKRRAVELAGGTAADAVVDAELAAGTTSKLRRVVAMDFSVYGQNQGAAAAEPSQVDVVEIVGSGDEKVEGVGEEGEEGAEEQEAEEDEDEDENEEVSQSTLIVVLRVGRVSLERLQQGLRVDTCSNNPPFGTALLPLPPCEVLMPTFLPSMTASLTATAPLCGENGWAGLGNQASVYCDLFGVADFGSIYGAELAEAWALGQFQPGTVGDAEGLRSGEAGEMVSEWKEENEE